MQNKQVYLDYASTTPTDPKVVQAMLPYFSDVFANPSALYRPALKAKAAIDKSRQIIADFLGAKPSEIIFTSGGTESDNLAILGIARFIKKGHIVTSQIEHPAVLNSCKQLKKEGFEVTYLKPDHDGFISPQDVKKALKKNTILVSIMYANNEIGTIQPVKEISNIIRDFKLSKFKSQNSNKSQFPKSKNLGFSALDLMLEKSYPLFHSDSCQAAEYLDMNVSRLGVDLLTFNGSKIYGPKGIGVLYIKEGTKIELIIYGGGQENQMRSGTENVPLIVGIAEAVKLIKKSKTEKAHRDYLIRELLKIKDVSLNGSIKNRLDNNVNVSIKGVEGESAVLYLDREGIFVSTGSACSSKSLEPSHVIQAIGAGREAAHSSLRITLGRKTTKTEIDYFLKKVKIIVENLREISA
ncbi:MAG: cysteine desulfurase family protein [Candidatus Berkelbacteria bacterium]|nr:cysteine desulfurase family protein [Candidatus Berkelbacteria bacterium]